MSERLLLSHFSATPGLVPRSVGQRVEGGPKPRGLWVSVDGPRDWEAWCRDEEWGIETLTYRFRVTLAADAELLHIGTEWELRELAAAWPGGELIRYDMAWAIDWAGIARHYQGVIVAPYQWGCRLDPGCSWYYGWDCASGCIWDASAIESTELIDARGTTPHTLKNPHKAPYRPYHTVNAAILPDSVQAI